MSYQAVISSALNPRHVIHFPLPITTTTLQDITTILETLFEDGSKYNSQADDFSYPELNFNFSFFYYKLLSFFIYMTGVYATLINDDVIVDEHYILTKDTMQTPENSIFKNINPQFYKLIILPIVYVFNNDTSHMLIMIYRPEYEMLILFDPSTNMNPDEYNSILLNFQNYLRQFDMTILYKQLPGSNCIQYERYSPAMRRKTLQSRYHSEYDPIGYCVIWTVLYIERLIQFPNKEPEVILSELKDAAHKCYSYTRFARTVALKRLSCLYNICKNLIIEYPSFKNVNFIDIPKSLLHTFILNYCYKNDNSSVYLETNKSYYEPVEPKIYHQL